MITTREPRLRLRGHGGRLRLHASSSDDTDPLALLRECCRASVAVEKAMGEAVSSARAAGRGWDEIARVLAVPGDATTSADVMKARAELQRLLWQRFWREDRPELL